MWSWRSSSRCIVGWEGEDPPELNSAVSHPLWLLPAKVFTKLDAIDLEFNQNFSIFILQMQSDLIDHLCCLEGPVTSKMGFNTGMDWIGELCTCLNF